jgi:hypothetical protein
VPRRELHSERNASAIQQRDTDVHSSIEALTPASLPLIPFLFLSSPSNSFYVCVSTFLPSSLSQLFSDSIPDQSTNNDKIPQLPNDFADELFINVFIDQKKNTLYKIINIIKIEDSLG